MSDTPLTDAEVKKVVGLPQPVDFDLMATHARRLEKALKVAEEALEACRVGCSITNLKSVADAIAEEQKRIAKLKEAA